jgi:hypothetical protein
VDILIRYGNFIAVDNYSLKPLKIIKRNIANNKLCYIILSTMALLWEFSPLLWFPKPQEDLSTMALLWEFTPLLWFSKPQKDKTQ